MIKTPVLPDKLSELLTLALRDLETCSADPRYRIDMNKWHEFDTKTCVVCLGGSVLACTLNIPEWLTVTAFDVPETISQKLQALNMLQSGYIAEAFWELDRPVPAALQCINYNVPCASKLKAWWMAMWNIVSILQEAGE